MKYSGLIGFPVAHSLSPQMQDAGFAALGIEARYKLWETPASELEARVNTLRSPDHLGANVTIPYKEAVLPWLDECDAQAVRIGAVNTIVNRHGRLIGYNTDAPGFLCALQEQAGPDVTWCEKQAILLGSGGAARGAAIALLDKRVATLSILGRSRARVEALLADLRPHAGQSILRGKLFGTPEAAQILAQGDLLVNTTSVGLNARDPANLIDVELLPRSALVMDMIFNPPQTPLLRAASERGCVTLNGLSMLLYQGTLALELWTNQPAPVAVMRAALGLE